jgi:hypothetical protein
MKITAVRKEQAVGVLAGSILIAVKFWCFCSEFDLGTTPRKVRDNEQFEYYIQRSEGRLTCNQVIGKEKGWEGSPFP